MTVSARLRLILRENNLKQKEFAAKLKVTESYISKLLRENNINISAQFLELLEEKFGYNSEWVLTGREPKIKNIFKNKELTDIHKQVIECIEKMSPQKLRAVTAFINSLEEVYNEVGETNYTKHNYFLNEPISNYDKEPQNVSDNPTEVYYKYKF